MNYFKIVPLCLLAAFVYIACNKKTPQLETVNTDFSSAATVQIFNATVKAARNYIYVDGVAISGSILAYGGIFPATAYGVKVATGARSFLIKDTLSTTTQVPLSFMQNFETGKSYTVFTYDTTTSIKQITITNSITIPTDTTSRFRFANFVYNTAAVANVDVYSFRKGGLGGTAATPIFSNIATNTATDFIPYASGNTDTLYIYATGTTTPLLVKGLVPSFTPSRSYTATYNGSYKGTKAVTTFITY